MSMMRLLRCSIWLEAFASDSDLVSLVPSQRVSADAFGGQPNAKRGRLSQRLLLPIGDLEFIPTILYLEVKVSICFGISFVLLSS